MTAPSCTCGRCHHCGAFLWVDEHSAVCGNGCVKFADHVALVVSERKRALEAWQKAEQLQTELATLKAAHAWIKTSERMPPVEPGSDMDVLAVVAVYNSGRFVENVTMVLNYCPGYPEENDQCPWTGECCGVYGNDEVTHWQPLTEPPK